ARCRLEWDGQRRIRSLARIPPAPVLPASRRLALRAAILERAPRLRPRPRSRWLLPLSLAAGLALSARLIIHRSPDHSPAAAAARRGVVTARGAARFTWIQEGPDEMVRVDDGQVTIEVRPLGPGERFRAITDDAQVEVRGTSFDLAVRTGHLEAVRVWHGRVEVRPQ